MNKRPAITSWLCGIALGVLTGCAQSPLAVVASPEPTAATTQPPSPIPETASATPVPSMAAPTAGRESILEMGTGEYVGQPRATDANTADTNDPKDITLNFEATELREFVRVIMEDVFKAPYVIDPKVAGKVTVHTGGPIARSEVLPLFDQLLAMNGAALTKVDDLYHIVPKATAARGTNAPTTAAEQSGYATRIIPLQYLAATEMQKILEPYRAEGANIRIDMKRN